jgi:hypothetical protein
MFLSLWELLSLLLLFVILFRIHVLITIKNDIGDKRCHSCLRHYATSRKVAVSIPDEVIWFFNWPYPSSRIMALESTQPLTEMRNRNIPGGKERRARKDDLTAICEPTV